MEKYNSNNMSSHKNVFNNKIKINFDKEDGKCGMIVSLEEIVDVWLETLEPELHIKREVNGGADMICVGEGEVAISQLVEAVLIISSYQTSRPSTQLI